VTALTDMYDEERATGAGHHAALSNVSRRTGIDLSTVTNAFKTADANRERPAAACRTLQAAPARPVRSDQPTIPQEGNR
jgi:hypothetical protein